MPPDRRLDQGTEKGSRFVGGKRSVSRYLLSAQDRGTSMRKFALATWSFLVAEDGPTAVEYAVMMAMIIMVCFVAIMTFGTKTNSLFQNAASSIH